MLHKWLTNWNEMSMSIFTALKKLEKLVLNLMTIYKTSIIKYNKEIFLLKNVSKFHLKMPIKLPKNNKQWRLGTEEFLVLALRGPKRDKNIFYGNSRIRMWSLEQQGEESLNYFFKLKLKNCLKSNLVISKNLKKKLKYNFKRK